MTKRNQKIKKAFTIIEFMLAMSFLGLLLVAIASLSVRVLQIYQKGLVIKAVNETGKAIIDDMSNAISSSSIRNDMNPVINASGKEVELKDVLNKRSEYFKPFYDSSNTETKVQRSGIFCTPSYAFIWNTAPTIKEDREILKNSSALRNNNYYKGATGLRLLNNYFYDNYNNNTQFAKDAIAVLVIDSEGTPKSLEIPKFARIPNSDDYCKTNDDLLTPGKPYTFSNKGELSFSRTTPVNGGSVEAKGIVVKEDDFAELINQDVDDNDLAIYDLVVQPAYQSNTTLHTLYNISFIVGTVNGGININSSGDYCTGSETGDADEFTMSGFEYCALNRFDFAAIQTGQAL